MRKLWRKFDEYITNMSQDTFDLIMAVIIVVLLVIGGIFILPKAVDAWLYEEYEKPAIEYKETFKKSANTQPIEQSIEYEIE